MASLRHETGQLQGELLVAMPMMQDPRFERSLIYLCAHSPTGAMGLIVNKPIAGVTFPDLLEQLGIEGQAEHHSIRIHNGGPVEPGRGFVLHSNDYQRDATLLVGPHFGLTATIDVLKAIAEGQGPRHSLLALGYAGWGPGQLDAEIQANGWLLAPADDGLLFDQDDGEKWMLALKKLKIDPRNLSTEAGHA
jgi:putative transcriptional regulator